MWVFCFCLLSLKIAAGKHWLVGRLHICIIAVSPKSQACSQCLEWICIYKDFFLPQQLPNACVTYNSASLFRFLFSACQNNPDHPISSHPHPFAQWLGGAAAVILTLCLDDLITVCPQTKLYFQVLRLWPFNPPQTLLRAGLPVPVLLSSWLGRRYSSGQFLLSAVVSGFPLSPLNNYFSRLLPPVEASCILLRLCFCLVPSTPLPISCLPPVSSPLVLSLQPSSTQTASQLGGVLCNAVCRKSGVLAVVIPCRRPFSPQS